MGRITVIPIPERVQARLDAAQTAEILGFAEHDIPVLVRVGLLKPLGSDPVQNSRKYFAAVEIFDLANDVKWLSKATQAVSANWQAKNASRSKKTEENEESLVAA